MKEDARAAVAQRHLRRMGGLLREASHELAALLGDADVLGTHRAHDDRTRQQAIALIDVGLARYGEVEVVVIARPKRAPTKGADAPKEQHANENQPIRA